MCCCHSQVRVGAGKGGLHAAPPQHSLSPILPPWQGNQHTSGPMTSRACLSSGDYSNRFPSPSLPTASPSVLSPGGAPVGACAGEGRKGRQRAEPGLEFGPACSWDCCDLRHVTSASLSPFPHLSVVDSLPALCPRPVGRQGDRHGMCATACGSMGLLSTYHAPGLLLGLDLSFVQLAVTP